MLNAMRRGVKSWGAYLLFGVLLVSFGIWGIGDIFRGNPERRTVATVGDTKITVAELQTEFRRQFEQLRGMLGSGITQQDAKQGGLLDQSLQNLIGQTLRQQVLAEYQWQLGNEAAINELKNIPDLVVNGRINPVMLQALLRQSNLTEAELLRLLGLDRANTILNQVVLNGASVPATLVDNLYTARARQFVVEVLKLPHANQTLTTQPTDADLEQYLDQAPGQFMVPEQRDAAVLQLPLSALEESQNPTEEQIAAALPAATAALTKPGKASFRQLVLPSEEAANTARTQGLDAYAKANNLSVNSFNDLSETENLPETAAALRNLRAGQISAPYQTSFGWNIVQLVAQTPTQAPSANVARAAAIARAKTDMAADALNNLSKKIDDGLAAGTNLADLAKEIGGRFAELPNLAEQPRKEEEKLAAWALALPNLRPQLFALNEGETSSQLDDGQGGIMVITHTKRTAAVVPPLAEIRPAVVTAWQTNMRAQQANARATTIVSEFNQGKVLASQVSAPQVVRVNFKPFSPLTRAESDLPPPLQEVVQKLSIGQVTSHSTADADYVVQLVRIEAAPTAAPAQRTRLANELLRQSRDDIGTAIESAWRERHPITINTTELDRLRNQNDAE